MRTIDLNCDVGEGVGREPDLLPLVSSANIACGAHAGDDETMAHTMALAHQHGVCVGAHPGYADRENFGRREQALTSGELRQLIMTQLATLRRHGRFHYVKPHGALYNLAARDAVVARTLAEAVQEFDAGLGLMGLAGGELLQAGEEHGLRVIREGFADRAYDAAGRLVARTHPQAVITCEEAAVNQMMAMIHHGRVPGLDGDGVEVQVDSICLHGDNPAAVSLARGLRAALKREGVSVLSPLTPPA